MRILAIADEEDEWLVRRLLRGDVGSCDLVVSCGDLDTGYLDFVMSMTNAPLLYVRGNHDVDYEANPPLGGVDLDGRVVEIDGVRFAGLEGSVRYREGIVAYSQGEMRRRVMRLALLARATGGIDVLVTHAPPRGFGDLPDLPHQGFDTFNGLLARTRPKIMLHGHVHLNYGRIERERTHASGTRVINAFGWQEIELGAHA